MSSETPSNQFHTPRPDESTDQYRITMQEIKTDKLARDWDKRFDKMCDKVEHWFDRWETKYTEDGKAHAVAVATCAIHGDRAVKNEQDIKELKVEKDLELVAVHRRINKVAAAQGTNKTLWAAVIAFLTGVGTLLHSIFSK